MTTRASIDSFLACRSLAVVGVSRSGKKFSNGVFRDLKSKGYQLFPVNNQTETVEGETCYPSLQAIPQPVEGIVFIIPPTAVMPLLTQVVERGIKQVWLQQGAESDEAAQFCRSHGINVVNGECLLMFARPTVFFHRLHRGLRRILGRLPS